jgi:hypothetical protein
MVNEKRGDGAGVICMSFVATLNKPRSLCFESTRSSFAEPPNMVLMSMDSGQENPFLASNPVPAKRAHDASNNTEPLVN